VGGTWSGDKVATDCRQLGDTRNTEEGRGECASGTRETSQTTNDTESAAMSGRCTMYRCCSVPPQNIARRGVAYGRAGLAHRYCFQPIQWRVAHHTATHRPFERDPLALIH